MGIKEEIKKKGEKKPNIKINVFTAEAKRSQGIASSGANRMCQGGQELGPNPRCTQLQSLF